MFKSFRSMASVGTLPDLSHVRPTGARVAVRRLLVLCRATLPTLTRSLSELDKRFEWLRRSGPWGPSEVVKPSPAPTATIKIEPRVRQWRVLSRSYCGRCPIPVPTAIDTRKQASYVCCGRCGRCLTVLTGTLPFSSRQPYRPAPFKTASNAVVADEQAPRAPGPDGTVETLQWPLRASCSGDRASPTRPGTGSPDTSPPPPRPERPRGRRRSSRRKNRRLPPGRKKVRTSTSSSVRRIIGKGRSPNFAQRGSSEVRMTSVLSHVVCDPWAWLGRETFR